MTKDEIRERLIEILETHCDYAGHVDCREDCTKCLADHLIANGVTIQKWIPVSERLPDEEGEVLLYDTEYEGICMGEYCKGNKIIEAYWFVGGHAFPVAEYTHWMPLPMPPKEVE